MNTAPRQKPISNVLMPHLEIREPGCGRVAKTPRGSSLRLMRIRISRLPLFGLFVALGVRTVSALSIINYDPDLHNRFESGWPAMPLPNSDSSFIGAGLDFSGVGWNPSDLRQNFAMINDRQFVLAFHFPPASAQIDFFSPVNGRVSYAIDSNGYVNLVHPTTGQRSDLRVGTLTTVLNPADQIAVYPILSFSNLASYDDRPLVVYGFGDSSGPRIGQNTLDAVQNLDVYDGKGTATPTDDQIYTAGQTRDQIADTITFSYDQDAATGEAFAQSGDSGGPSFSIFNGQLALLGTHVAIDSSPNTTFDTFIPAYLDQLAGAGVSFTTVPEPGTPLLICMGMSMLLLRRRRSW